MKKPTPLNQLLFWLCLFASLIQYARAQPPGCTFKDPIVKIDFGRGGDVADINASEPQNYGRIYGSCPTDGHYTFTSATYDCFAGDWFTLAEDHTPGDKDGNMMLINASPGGGVFLNKSVTGLTGGKTYEFAIWMINVCRLHICCSDLSPNVSIQLNTPAGRKLAGFRIGELPQRTNAQWRKFAGYFTLPAGEKSVVITMQNNTVGGCGNDFALDDITFRECVPPTPAFTAAPKKVITPVKKEAAPVQKPVAKKPVEPKPESKPPQRTVAKAVPVLEQKKEQPAQTLVTPARHTALGVPPPPVLRSRANPLIRQLDLEAGELVIDLYDNGQIDGDTVSVYHNNKLIVPETRLTQAPIRFRVMVDKANPYHELVMVAHNLGSIPPNTSLMVVTANDKRYQVHISASEQKNAKVVVQLKE